MTVPSNLNLIKRILPLPLLVHISLYQLGLMHDMLQNFLMRRKAYQHKQKPPYRYEAQRSFIVSINPFAKFFYEHFASDSKYTTSLYPLIYLPRWKDWTLSLVNFTSLVGLLSAVFPLMLGNAANWPRNKFLNLFLKTLFISSQLHLCLTHAIYGGNLYLNATINQQNFKITNLENSKKELRKQTLTFEAQRICLSGPFQWTRFTHKQMELTSFQAVSKKELLLWMLNGSVAALSLYRSFKDFRAKPTGLQNCQKDLALALNPRSLKSQAW